MTETEKHYVVVITPEWGPELIEFLMATEVAGGGENDE